MIIKKSSVCIVASTLPVAFIASQITELNIKKIIVTSQSLQLSYQGFKKISSSIKVVRAPIGFVRQSIFFFFQLCAAKLNGNSVVIFHECCLPVLDLLINFMKPSGYFLPQVKMSGWEEIAFDLFPKGKLTCFLRAFGFSSLFKYYRCSSIGGDDNEYALSIKQYCDSIVPKEINFSREKIEKYYSVLSDAEKKILFVMGRSFVSDSAQLNIYKELITIAHAKGYVCHIKDHPNLVYRLDLSSCYATALDPFLPVELLERDYYLVVGVSSTSLLAFNGRSISLINIFDEMSPEDRVYCTNHFDDADPHNNIKYINSIGEFSSLL